LTNAWDASQKRRTSTTRDRRLRATPQQREGVAVPKVGFYEQTEPGQEVEVAFQWNTGYYESIHSFANGIATIEGGMHEEGFRKAITNVVNRYARKRNLLRKGREPGRRGHPRGPHGDRVRSPGRAAVRGSDEGQARQRRHSFVGGTSTNEKLATGSRRIRKRADRSSPSRCKRHGPVKRRATRAISRDARARSTAPDSRASSSTVRPTNRASANCSSSRATRPEGRRRTRAIRASRRSCRFEARS